MSLTVPLLASAPAALPPAGYGKFFVNDTGQQCVLMPDGTTVTPAAGGVTKRGSYNIPNGQSYAVIAFGAAFASAAWYPVNLTLRNTVDGSALNLFPGIMSAKSAGGFTIQLNGATDSANYYLDYTCILP